MLTFTGTSYQIAWKQKIHDVLVLNELGGNTALAYVLSYAGSKSGYSFGYAQWDIAKNATAAGILKDILQNAKNADGQYIIADGDQNTGRADDTVIKALMEQAIKPGGTSLTTEQRNLINQALSSAYGQNTIDQRHDQYLGEVLTFIDNIIASANPGDQAFLNSDIAKLFLADYHNQFNIDLPPKPAPLYDYLRRIPGALGGGTVLPVGEFGVDDLLNFYFSTTYATSSYSISTGKNDGRDGLNDELRRFNNVVIVAGGFMLPTNVQAREEEAKGLLRVYQDFLKGKQGQLSYFSGFNTNVLEYARVALIGQYVNDAGIGTSINGEVIVGEDQSSLSRNTKRATDTDLLTGSDNNDLVFGESGNDTLRREAS